MHDDWATDTIKTRTLNALAIGGTFAADRYALEFREEPFTGVLVAQWRTYVLSDNLAKDRYEHTYHHPASWFQHWKRDHAPQWWLRRWPVRTEGTVASISVERCLTYPEAAIRVPDLGPYRILERVSERWNG